MISATESRERDADDHKNSKPESSSTTLVTHSANSFEYKHIMLSTAVVHVFDASD